MSERPDRHIHENLKRENAALREAGEGLDVMLGHYIQNSQYQHRRVGEYRARWREVAGEPDPIIPGYGSSI